MLGKLLKYEMKSTSRVMWFLYAAVIIVGTIIGIVLRINFHTADMNIGTSVNTMSVFGLPQILLIVFVTIYALLLVALAIMTIIMIIIRFNSNLLKGEGYLMHTLPVPTWMLVTSKTIISFLWMVIGAAVSVLSAVLLGLTSGMLPYLLREAGLKELWHDLCSMFGSVGWLYIIAIIVSCIVLILQFYFSMAVGNIANRNKFLLAVATFIGVQIVVSIISGILGTSSTAMLMESSVFDLGTIRGAFSSLMVKSIILNLIFGAGFFAGTTLILKKRLNLA